LHLHQVVRTVRQQATLTTQTQERESALIWGRGADSNRWSGEPLVGRTRHPPSQGATLNHSATPAIETVYWQRNRDSNPGGMVLATPNSLAGSPHQPLVHFSRVPNLISHPLGCGQACSGGGGVESNSQGHLAVTRADFKSGPVANRVAPPCTTNFW
jgi:hypothetical protein